MAKKRQSIFAGKVASSAKRFASRGSGYGYLNLPKNVKIFKAEPKTMVSLDFIPYEVTTVKHPELNGEIASKGSLWWRRPFEVHRNVGENNDTVICLTSFGKKCPICEYRKKRAMEGAEKEELRALGTSLRYLYAVIPIGSKTHPEEVHIWDMSHYLFQEMLDEEMEIDESVEIFPELVGGLTLQIRFRAGSMGSGKPFAETSKIDFLEREDYDESILKEVPHLDDVLQELSYDELSAKFFEMETTTSEDDFEEEEEEAPAPARRRRPAPEPEPEEEEEQPKRPARKTRPAPEPEPEEEEEEEEEEEAPAPAPARRRTPAPVPKSTSKDKCPNGLKFGVDTDTNTKCDSCDLWDECIEEKERK